jgi:hypothetical protein
MVNRLPPDSSAETVQEVDQPSLGSHAEVPVLGEQPLGRVDGEVIENIAAQPNLEARQLTAWRAISAKLTRPEVERFELSGSALAKTVRYYSADMPPDIGQPSLRHYTFLLSNGLQLSIGTPRGGDGPSSVKVSGGGFSSDRGQLDPKFGKDVLDFLTTADWGAKTPEEARRRARQFVEPLARSLGLL